MAFVVEDETGLIDANAYIEVAFADDYFTDRGIADWTGTSTEKETAIVRATDYIEQRWGPQFKGIKEFPETPQALSFPRLYLFDKEGRVVEGVPLKLEKATAEYALRALTGTLYPDPTASDSATLVREKIGPIEEETRYDAGTISDTAPSYPPADALLAEYIYPKGVIRN